MLEAIATVARYTQTQKDLATLLRHAQMIKRDSQQAISDEIDKKDIEERFEAVELGSPYSTTLNQLKSLLIGY